MASRPNLTAELGVAALFAITLAFQVRFTYDSLDRNLHITERARLPFVISSPAGAVEKILPEAEAAGLKNSDLPISIEGTPLHGMARLSEVVAARRAGDAIRIQATRSGQQIQAVIRLAPASATPVTLRDWVLIGFLSYLTPWFSIALGFTVAFLRPRDPLAWLLLLLMLSFKEIGQGDSFVPIALAWPGWLRAPAIFNQKFLVDSWPVAMMLFGQYFPTASA
jgi:hypothetical protein